MGTRDLIVIGASAGGLDPLITILRGLPADLPGAIVIVIHTRSGGGLLAQMLSRRSGRVVGDAVNRAELVPGRILVAPADRHVLIGPTGLRVVRGPRENGFRPAIDPLFRSAARVRGEGAIGVILSGALDDGANGLAAIVRRGGGAIVQAPDDAEIPSMPIAALRQTQVDAVLPAARIAEAIVRLSGGTALQDETPMPREDEVEPQRGDLDVADMERQLGAPTPITCPACGGALWESADADGVRYQCHVGHQYAPDSLLAEHGEAVEQALWSAVRVLEQHAELRRRMSRRAESAGMAIVARNFAEDSRDYQNQARDVRRLIEAAADRVPADAVLPHDGPRRRARAR